MNNSNWFDYLAQIFHQEHNLTRVILIGEDNAIRVLAVEDTEDEKGESQ